MFLKPLIYLITLQVRTFNSLHDLILFYILPIEWDITLGINSVNFFSPVPIFSKSFNEMCFVGGGSVTFSLSQSREEREMFFMLRKVVLICYFTC